MTSLILNICTHIPQHLGTCSGQSFLVVGLMCQRKYTWLCACVSGCEMTKSLDETQETALTSTPRDCKGFQRGYLCYIPRESRVMCLINKRIQLRFSITEGEYCYVFVCMSTQISEIIRPRSTKFGDNSLYELLNVSFSSEIMEHLCMLFTELIQYLRIGRIPKIGCLRRIGRFLRIGRILRIGHILRIGRIFSIGRFLRIVRKWMMV